MDEIDTDIFDWSQTQWGQSFLMKQVIVEALGATLAEESWLKIFDIVEIEDELLDSKELVCRMNVTAIVGQALSCSDNIE